MIKSCGIVCYRSRTRSTRFLLVFVNVYDAQCIFVVRQKKRRPSGPTIGRYAQAHRVTCICRSTKIGQCERCLKRVLLCLCGRYRAYYTLRFFTLSRPRTSLEITSRSFLYASPHLWNQLPVSFRQPCIKHPADDVTLSNSPPTCSSLSPSIKHSLFHSKLKTHLFHKSFPP